MTDRQPNKTTYRHADHAVWSYHWDSHLCRVADNTMWSHMACEFPVAVKS